MYDPISNPQITPDVSAIRDQWIAAWRLQRRGVFVPIMYFDINDGNQTDALMFAQIMYWHMPNNETGETRLRLRKDGHFWLAKNHKDWYTENRVKKSSAIRSLERIRERGLIVYELHGMKGNVTPWMRVNWSILWQKTQEWITDNPQDSIGIPHSKLDTPLPNLSRGLPKLSDSNTESTTESTKKLSPPPNGNGGEPTTPPNTAVQEPSAKPRTPKQLEQGRLWECAHLLAHFAATRKNESVPFDAITEAEIAAVRNGAIRKLSRSTTFAGATPEQFAQFLADFRAEHPNLDLAAASTIETRLSAWLRETQPQTVTVDEARRSEAWSWVHDAYLAINPDAGAGVVMTADAGALYMAVRGAWSGGDGQLVAWADKLEGSQ